ncbi:MAG: tryptophan synthase subunit alpha [Fimbriimonadaceae bacterium]
MPELQDRFRKLSEIGEKALVLFVTAGDPPLDQLPAILACLEEAGADVIELGIPFSDPIADGPTIQASSQRALDRGVTPSAVIESLSKCSVGVPVVLMGYYNPVLRIGLREFAQQAREAGASGTIISDLTPEESEPWVSASRQAGLDTIFLVAPTSTPERIKMACRDSTGFVYAVSRTGVTGTSDSLPAEVSGLVAGVKACTETPVCVGFGISKPEHVRSVCEVADGAVVGSWLVDSLAREWDDGRGSSKIGQSIRALKAAAKR